MFRKVRDSHIEPIRLGADGFCFSLPDGSERVVLEGPVTFVPGTVTDSQDQERCYLAVFPDMSGCRVFADRIEGLDGLLLCGAESGTARLIETEHAEAAVTCRLHDLLAEMAGRECGTLAAEAHGDRVDVVAVRNGRLLYLNCIRRSEGDFKVGYYIVKVWKEFRFNGSRERLRVSGLEDRKLLDNIALMTGVKVECES